MLAFPWYPQLDVSQPAWYFTQPHWRHGRPGGFSNLPMASNLISHCLPAPTVARSRDCPWRPRKVFGDGAQPVKLGYPPLCLKSDGPEARSGRRHYRIGEFHSSFPPSRYSLWGRSTGSCTLFLLQARLYFSVSAGVSVSHAVSCTLVNRQGTVRWSGRSEVLVELQRTTDLSIDPAHGLPICSPRALQVPTKTDASCKQ